MHTHGVYVEYDFRLIIADVIGNATRKIKPRNFHAFIGSMFCQYMCQLAETDGLGVELKIQQISRPKQIKVQYIPLGPKFDVPTLLKKKCAGCMHDVEV